MCVPVTLKTFFRVILALQFKEITELRIAALDLFASSVPGVGQVVRAPAAYRHINEPTESIRRVLQTLRAVNSVQIEDGARIGLLRPRQEAFVIAFDNADRAINQIDCVLAKILAYFSSKAWKHGPWHVDFRDDFSGRIGSVEFLVDFAVIVIGIDAQLVSV